MFFLIFVCLVSCKNSTDPPDEFSMRQILDLNQYENQYELVFVWEQEIFTIKSNGSDLKQLTKNDFYDHTPFWTMSGEEIIFTTSRYSDNISLYKMNSDGTNEIHIGAKEYWCDTPKISPSGQSLVYIEGRRDPFVEILVRINLDGSDRMEIFEGSNIRRPDWSPDGQKLIFDDLYFIYQINNDGSNLLKLTDSTYRSYDADWSPGGERIAFVYISDDDDREIYIMDIDGQNIQNLTNNPIGMDHTPVFSPDGSKILFISNRDGDSDAYIMNVDGGEVVNLTNETLHFSYYPTWSPDGTRIAYAADVNEDGNNETVYIMDIATGNYQKLTSGLSSPQWNPIKIVSEY